MNQTKRHLDRNAATPWTNLPIEERIRLRAYELYQGRRCAPGHEWDDWLLAEHELKAERGHLPVQGSSRPETPSSPQH